jgi:glutamate 5-kinase
MAGGLDATRVDALVSAIANHPAEIVLVSSGAIAAGLAPLGLPRRPRDLATQQAAASVGQGLLMRAYNDAFARHRRIVGQVLLTVDDVTRRAHYRNAFRTLRRLLDLGAVPIVNENDTVATEEIRFGDNDRLAALVPRCPGRRPDPAVRRGPVWRPELSRSRAITDVCPDETAGVNIRRSGKAGPAPAAWLPRSKRRGSPPTPNPGRAHLGRAGRPGARRRGRRHHVPPGAERPAACLFWLAHATTARPVT